MSTQIGIYRANITPIDRLIKTTVGRKAILGDITERLLSNAGKKGGQHYLFIGPRGIGKTHFLTLIKNSVKEDKKLESLYTVIRFPEENNRILSFADLLLGITEILGEVINDSDFQSLYTSLSENENDQEIIDTIVPRLRKYQKDKKKTILILLENLDTLFTQQIKNEQDVHRFRTFLMDSPCASLIGTSPVYFKSLSNEKSPLYDFFDIQRIEDLTEEQTIKVIRKNLEWDQKDSLLKDFDSLIPKIKAMHTMTSGNPRLIITLYELVANDNLMEVKIQFQELLDRISPFYQERMKDLAPQERALLETMALMRSEPRTPANIAKRLRKSQQQVSSLLKRMTKSGYITVSVNPRDKRSRLYRIKEGFFDFWLAMSESRVLKKRLGYLVEFFEMYYRDREDREKKREELWGKLEKDIEETANKENHIDLLGYLSEIGDTYERCQTKIELAVHKIKDGCTKEAEGFIKEVESISPQNQTFLWMTEQAQKWAKGDADLDVSKWLDEMIEYWQTQRSGDLEKAVSIAHRLGEDFSGHGLHKIRVELLRDALEHTKDSGEKCRLYSEMAESQSMDGMIHEALTSLQHALLIYKEKNDKSGIAVILHQMGNIHYAQGDYDRALEKYNQSLKIKEELGDKRGISNTLHQLGMIHHDQGDYDKAIEKYNQSLKIAEELGDKSGIAITLHQLGNIHHDQGDYDKAIEKYNQSLKIKEELGDKSGIASTLHQLGIIHHAQGDYDKAIEKYNQSMKIAEELGNKSGIASTLHQLGMIHHAQGDYDKAIEKYNQSMKIAEELGNKSGIAITLHQLGMIHHDQGDYDKAIEKYNHSMKIAEELGNKSGIAITLGQMGRVYEAREDYRNALKNFLICFSIFDSLKSPYRDLAAKHLNNLKESLGENLFKKYYEELMEEIEKHKKA